MPNITYISHTGESRTVTADAGVSVMQAAVRNGVPGIVADCGGECQCATCHVYVDEKFLGLLKPAEEDEDAMLTLTASERKPNSRLSCQIAITDKLDGLIVTTPEIQQ
ncbi:MAG: 2Fe-2S iron-sulfur cluster binding protein [Bryobacterales bacterium]|jgi:2Fe-2S ferredoxin|nr:2Fe-2S iron-sulfur cluster binding protein [Bryobacterales bacterium]